MSSMLLKCLVVVVWVRMNVVVMACAEFVMTVVVVRQSVSYIDIHWQIHVSVIGRDECECFETFDGTFSVCCNVVDTVCSKYGT